MVEKCIFSKQQIMYPDGVFLLVPFREKQKLKITAP